MAQLLFIASSTTGSRQAYLDFGTERGDSRAAITDDGYPLICVNSNHPGYCQRFSLACQLGYQLMHTCEPVDDEQDISHEANHFAAKFLMPEGPSARTLTTKRSPFR